MIVMWLSEIITAKGIGNGSTTIIAMNIVSSLSNLIISLLKTGTNPFYLFFTLSILIIGTIYSQQTFKKFSIITAKQLYQPNINSNVNYLGIKINQGGVMTIIFSTTILTFFTFIANGFVESIKFSLNSNFVSIIYTLANFCLIIFSNLIYTNFFLNPREISENLNRLGVAIPGVRPGLETTSYLRKKFKRISIIGGILTGLLVIVPKLTQLPLIGLSSIIILITSIIEVTRDIKKITIKI